MKEIKKRELELLEKVCSRNNIPLKMAKALIKTAEKLSYENNTQGSRISEYQELISFHSKK